MPESALQSLITSSVLTKSTAKAVTEMVRLLVLRPDRVAMKIRNDGKTVTLMLGVAPDDIGNVIGKQGRTARSLRILLNSVSSQTGVRFALDIHAEQP